MRIPYFILAFFLGIAVLSASIFTIFFPKIFDSMKSNNFELEDYENLYYYPYASLDFKTQLSRSKNYDLLSYDPPKSPEGPILIQESKVNEFHESTLPDPTPCICVIHDPPPVCLPEVRDNPVLSDCSYVICNCAACDYNEIDRDYYSLSIRRNEGRTVGDNSSYTTLEAFAFPFNCQNFLPFLDLRTHVFDNCSRYGANVGAGFRVAPECCEKFFGIVPNQIFGINAYYDYRDYRRAKFNQFGLGFEVIGECLSFRLNGYLPLGNKEILNSSCFFDDYIGDYFFIQENFIDSLQGINFEFESMVARICYADIYAALGSYFYTGNSCGNDIYGAEYRLTARMCDRYMLSLCATHDCVYHTRVQAELTLAFPCSGCDWRLFQPVRRHEVIVLDKHSRFHSNF